MVERDGLSLCRLDADDDFDVEYCCCVFCDGALGVGEEEDC